MKLNWNFIICACTVMYASGQNPVKKRPTPLRQKLDSQYKINIKNSQEPTVKTTLETIKDEVRFRTTELLSKAKKIKENTDHINIPENAKVALINVKDLHNDTKLNQLEMKMRTDRPTINKLKMKLTSGDRENLNEKKWGSDVKDDEYASAEMDNIETDIEEHVQASEVLDHPNLDEDNDRYQANKAEVLKIEDEHLKNEYETSKKELDDEEATFITPEKIIDEVEVDNYYDNMQEVTTQKQVATSFLPVIHLLNSDLSIKVIHNDLGKDTTTKESDIPLLKALEKVKLTSSGELDDSGEGVMRTRDDNDDDDDQLEFSIDGMDLREDWV